MRVKAVNGMVPTIHVGHGYHGFIAAKALCCYQGIDIPTSDDHA